MTAQISIEAMDLLLKHLPYGINADELRTFFDSVVITPPDPLDEIRARFQPLTRGGYDYFVACLSPDGQKYIGWVKDSARRPGYVCRCEYINTSWGVEGESWNGSKYDILPIAPPLKHAKLIAELEGTAKAFTIESRTLDMLNRAIDALKEVG